MLVLENIHFDEKFSEVNIRQRMYEEKNFITLIINTEFYPSLVNEGIVSGNIEVKLDVSDINSIDDLVGKSFSGEIGSVSISVNNNGIWEHQSYDNFKIDIIKRDGRKLEFLLEADNCNIKTTAVMVSLYTTSTNINKLQEVFDLSDFYDVPVIKEIGNSKVSKYYFKN